jgi:two-component system, cell cycle sensor histidine kinase and response regulator CckA
MIIEAVEDHSQPHILVVDDDVMMRDMARESLTKVGFSVSEAENGVRALQALEKLRPDIILMDVMMPEMDGFATASAVRQLPGFEVMPILIMTALDDLDSINRAYEVGATDFITKPINWVILIQRVRYMTRTARMMNEQTQLGRELQQAQKLEAVATLAGGIAHDFNNLLQAIQASSELLLLKTHKGEPGFRILNQIIDAVDRGGGLIRQLLTYSRKIKSDKRPIDLNDQAHQAHQLLQRTIPKMIGIELRLEENLKLVDADPVQIEQVLMNLAVNARDAMPDGGRLFIRTSNVIRPEKHGSIPSLSPSRQWVLLSVSDTGHGMDKETLEHIFEPFFTTKAPGKGTGLGLPMVHGIVKNHDGRITCRSTPGKGTCFRIYLPAAEPSREEKPVEEKKGVQEGNETLLLVDDEEVVRKTGKERLERAGYTVLTASGGEMALGVYRQKTSKIHLVLLDLIMPGMGGISCLYELLQTDPGVKVVIISGYSADEETLEVIEACTNGYLRKPYTGEQLLNTVRKALDGV